MRGMREVHFRGYTKRENGHWVAVCIDLNIVAQGASPEEATQTCAEMIVQYVDHVVSNYPDRLNEYIPRLAPPEFLAEYDKLLRKQTLVEWIRDLRESGKKKPKGLATPRMTGRPFSLPMSDALAECEA